MQILRSGFIVWAFGIKDTMGRNYAQLLAWSVIAGLFWIAGGLIHGHDARLAVWALAGVIDLTAPVHGFALPGAGSTPISGWKVAGGDRLAELGVATVVCVVLAAWAQIDGGSGAEPA
jgi:low temperature requirement protein LtrA